MTNTFSIKNATKTDLKEVLILDQICFQEDAFSMRQFSYLLKKANGEFIVVKNKQKLVGYIIFLRRKNGKKYRIYSLAIHPDARGLGIAKQLLEYAEKVALEHNTHKISLEVHENNKSAIQLYEKQGYKKKGLRHNYYSDGSSAIIMDKEL